MAHNELGHDAVKVKDYDGKVVTECPLYPGTTCRDHVDAAVDVDSTRDENLVAVPFIELCPNSWLVPPTGAPVRIAESDQFSPAKIKAQVKALRKDWGPVLPVATFGQIVNALGQAEAATDEDAWGKALQALAGVARFAPKPHAALKALVAARMAQIDEPVGWALEEIDEGSEPLVERRKAMQALRKQVDVAVYEKRLPALKAIDAWLGEHAKPAR
ncbi:MAG: hypothetical protein P1V36_11430 [Planctomycetota bacterium]|nr:hypothetical protein [Planctomycetota bacterium]